MTARAVTLAFAVAAAQTPPLPTLTIDPPDGFYRSAASDAKVQWYDSNIVNATLRIYTFRAVTTDPIATFQQTLLLDWTPLDVPTMARIGQPTFERRTMPGADTVVVARYFDSNARSHLRLAIVINGGRAVAIVHLRAETASGMDQVLPYFQKVMSTMKISGTPGRLAGGTGADTRAVAGLYMAPRLKLSTVPGASTMSTYYYLFSGDGRVYRGYGLPSAPNGELARFDYAAAAASDPENAGTFEIRGTQLVIQMGWQHAYTITTAVPDAAGRVTIESSTLTRQAR
jgi:hypothetical protein